MVLSDNQIKTQLSLGNEYEIVHKTETYCWAWKVDTLVIDVFSLETSEQEDIWEYVYVPLDLEEAKFMAHVRAGIAEIDDCC